jgi:hypothetical protein
MCQLHSTIVPILSWTDAEMLLANLAKQPAGNTDLLAGFRHCQWMDQIAFDNGSEPFYDDFVTFRLSMHVTKIIRIDHARKHRRSPILRNKSEHLLTDLAYAKMAKRPLV